MSDKRFTRRKTRIPPPMIYTTRVHVHEKLNVTERQDHKVVSRLIKASTDSICAPQSDKRDDNGSHLNPSEMLSPHYDCAFPRQSPHPAKAEESNSSDNLNPDRKSVTNCINLNSEPKAQHKILTAVQNLDCHSVLRSKNQTNEEPRVNNTQSDEKENGQELGRKSTVNGDLLIPHPSTPPPAHSNKKIFKAAVEPPKTPSGSSTLTATYDSPCHSFQNESISENENSLSASQRIRLGLSALHTSQNSLKASQLDNESLSESGKHLGISESESDFSRARAFGSDVKHIAGSRRATLEPRGTSEFNILQSNASADVPSQLMSPRSLSLRRARRRKSEMLVARLLPVTQNVNDLLSYVHELRRSETLLKLQLDHSRREVKELRNEFSLRILRLEKEMDQIAPKRIAEVLRRQQREEDVQSLTERMVELENVMREQKQGIVELDAASNGSKHVYQNNNSVQNDENSQAPEHIKSDLTQMGSCDGSELEDLTPYGPTGRQPVFTITPPTSESLLLASVAANESHTLSCASDEPTSTTQSEHTSTIIRPTTIFEQSSVSPKSCDLENKSVSVPDRTAASSKCVTFSNLSDQSESKSIYDPCVHLEQRLRAFFEKNDASRLKMARVYAKRYSDREDILLSELSRRYGESAVAFIRTDLNGSGMSQSSIREVEGEQDEPHSPPISDAVATANDVSSSPAHTTRKPALLRVSKLRPSSPPDSPCMSPHNFSLAPPSLFHGRQNAQPFSMTSTVFDEEQSVIDDYEKHYAKDKVPEEKSKVSLSKELIEDALCGVERMISSNSPASILPAPMIEQLPDEIADFCAETEVKEPEEEVYLSTPCPIPSVEITQNPSEIKKDIARGSDNVGIGSGAQKRDTTTLEELLHTFFRKHQPGKVRSIPQLIENFTGRERQLIEQLRSEYGSFSVRQLEQYLPVLKHCQPRNAEHVSPNDKKKAEIPVILRCVRSLARLLLRLSVIGLILVATITLINVHESDRLLQGQTTATVDQLQCTANVLEYDREGNFDISRWLEVFDFHSSNSSSLRGRAQQQRDSSTAICFALEWRQNLDKISHGPMHIPAVSKLLSLIPYSHVLIVPLSHILKAQVIDSYQYQKYGLPVVTFAQRKLHKYGPWTDSLFRVCFDYIHVMVQRLNKLCFDVKSDKYFSVGASAKGMSVFQKLEIKAVQSRLKYVFDHFYNGTQIVVAEILTVQWFTLSRSYEIFHDVWYNLTVQATDLKEAFSNLNVVKLMHDSAAAYKSLVGYMSKKCIFFHRERVEDSTIMGAIEDVIYDDKPHDTEWKTETIESSAAEDAESNVEGLHPSSPSDELLSEKGLRSDSSAVVPSRWSIKDNIEDSSNALEKQVQNNEERINVVHVVPQGDLALQQTDEMDAFEVETQKLKFLETIEDNSHAGDTSVQSSLDGSDLTTATISQDEFDLTPEEQGFVESVEEVSNTQEFDLKPEEQDFVDTKEEVSNAQEFGLRLEEQNFVESVLEVSDAHQEHAYGDVNLDDGPKSCAFSTLPNYLAESVVGTKKSSIIFLESEDDKVEAELDDFGEVSHALSKKQSVVVAEPCEKSFSESRCREIHVPDVVGKAKSSLSESIVVSSLLPEIEIDAPREDIVHEMDQFRTIYSDLLEVTAQLATQELDMRTLEHHR